jgi:hypothetical protein
MCPLVNDALKVLERITNAIFFYILSASRIVVESIPVHMRSDLHVKGVW